MRFTNSPYENMMRQKPAGRRAEETLPVYPPGHRCHNCPYGRSSPCLGVCLRNLMRKEEEKCSL